MKVSKNPILHGRSKHIDVKYYSLRGITKDGVINLIYHNSKDHIANISTKSFRMLSFVKLRKWVTTYPLKEIISHY